MDARRIIQCWIAVARSGKVAPSDWKLWADGLIASEPSLDEWLIILSMADDLDDLVKKASDFFQTPMFGSHQEDDAVLGYMWYRYKSGSLDLGDCLKAMGEEADGSSARIQCEQIYALLNDLDAHGDAERVTKQADSLFADVCLIAEEQWKEIFPES